jgi:glycosyltransferase involved in cell wall biosynthesis
MYGNPFQDLLYSKFSEVGINVFSHRSIAGAIKAVETSTAAVKILHLHWLNVVLSDVPESELEKQVGIFENQLARAKQTGAKIVWTVHNVLPHEGYQVEPSVAVRKIMIEAADLVHIMSPDTVERCAKYFDIPQAKVIQLEHAGYHGFYSPLATSKNLSDLWGLPRNAKVLVSMGGIKPYKGLGEFAKVFKSAADSNTHLLIAGKADTDFQQSELWKMAELSPNLHVLPEMISDSLVNPLISRADAVVIPYQASLNSGAMVLGLTFEKPILARSTAGSSHLLAAGAGRIYESESELSPLISDLSWLDAARVGATEVSRSLDLNLRARHTAEVFARFVEAGTLAAQQKAGEL